MKIAHLFNLVMILSLATLMSCGKESGSNVDALIRAESLKVANEILAAQDVACASDECPGFSAKLAFRARDEKGYGVGTCSGSLYQGKYIITNSHCIPDELKYAGADCKGALRAIFPITKDFSHEIVQCSRIIQAYKQGETGPDLAVFELERVVARTSVEVETNQFIDNSEVHAFTMNPIRGSHTGSIVKKTCLLSIDNIFYAGTTSDTGRALIHGYSCVIIGGNSGSGLLNKNGKLIGAVFARIDESIKETFEKNDINYKYHVPTGVVQNIGCVKSITASSGTNCIGAILEAADVQDFINRSIKNQLPNSTDSSRIRYEIVDGMKLKLTESTGYVDYSNSVVGFYNSWTKFLTTNSSERDATGPIKQLLNL